MKKLVLWAAITLGLIGIAVAVLIVAPRAGWVRRDDVVLR